MNLKGKNLVFVKDAIIDNTAIMLLNDEIGVDSETGLGLNTKLFAREALYLKSVGYDVKVKINSVGGGVGAGFDVVDAILEVGAATENIGIAASMSIIALVAGKKGKRSAKDYAVGMIHAPSGGSDEARAILQPSLETILEKRTKLTKDEISSYMDGKDHFFDSSQMLEMGIIDFIESTSDETVDASVVTAKLSSGEMEKSNAWEVYNKLQKKVKSNMDTVKAKLNLSMSVSDEKVLETIDSLKKDSLKVVDLTNDNNDLKAKLTAKEKEIEVINKDRAVVLVDSGIADGKISKDKREEMIALASEKYDVVKNIFDSVKKSAMSHSPVTDTLEIGDESKLDYNDLAMNNPEKLQAIADKQPELFNKLVAKRNKTKTI